MIHNTPNSKPILVSGNQQKKGNVIPLNSDEKQEFAECECAVAAYARSPFDAGRAMQRIRDNSLYREQFKSFSGYCLKKWDCTRSHADRLIGAWKVSHYLAPIGVIITCESQARPLIGLSEEQVLASGRDAVKLAGAEPLTAKHMRLASDQFRALKPKPPSRAPQKTPAELLQFVAAAEEAAKVGDTNTVLAVLDNLKRCLAPILSAVSDEIVPSDVVISTQLDPESIQTRSVVSESNPVDSIQVVDQPVVIDLGGVIAPITKWNQIPECVANYLIERGASIANLTFLRKDKSEFPRSSRLKILRDGSFIEVGDDRRTLLSKARRLLEESSLRDIGCIIRLASGERIDLVGGQEGRDDSYVEAPRNGTI